MNIEYLIHSDDSKKLILIIAGWNTTPDFYRHINPRTGWDLAVAYDFRILDSLQLPDHYSTIYLYAWSFGVVAAENSLPAERITEAFAIAGTPQGIGKFGIPEKIFKATKENLSLESLSKFRIRMFSGIDKQTRNTLINRLPANPDIEALAEELNSIENIEKKENINWRRAYVPAKDLIIPTNAQLESWKNNPHNVAIISYEGGHFPDMEEIIGSTLPDTSKTASAFNQSRSTYQNQASSQGYFARRLRDMVVTRFSGNKPGYNSETRQLKILEIGNGAGIFSRLLADIWPDADATFIDIWPTEHYDIFASETYIIADAESWLENAQGSWDIIVSSSTIQWFSNPRTFFRNAGRLLNPGGVVGCSIYSEGNLRELDALRPSPIHYHSGKSLANMASEYLSEITWEEEERRKHFNSAREVLLHLRDTGVRAGRKVPFPLLLKGLSDATLTYNATLIIANK